MRLFRPIPRSPSAPTARDNPPTRCRAKNCPVGSSQSAPLYASVHVKLCGSKLAGRKRGVLNGNEIFLEADYPPRNAADQRETGMHMCDVWFNGTYPFLDASSGGNIDGMIAGSARGLSLADADTKIVPGPRTCGRQSRPRKDPRHAGNGEGPGACFKGRREIATRSRSVKADRGSRCCVGKRHGQRRPVRDGSLFYCVGDLAFPMDRERVKRPIGV
jgi:hypothetical protein